MILDLYWLTFTLLITALMWLPYILQFIVEKGLIGALTEGNGTSTPKAKWAERSKKAHMNAVENLVIFAPLVLVAVMTQTTTELTALAAMVYFYTRLLHYIVFTLGLPFIRTLSFALGVGCQLVYAFTILGIM